LGLTYLAGITIEARLRVAVVGGCGAAGSVMVAALRLGGAEVDIIDRGTRGCETRELLVKGLWRGPVKVCGWDSVRGPYDVAMLFTKSYDASGALEGALRLEPRLLVSPHNGLGALELLEGRVGSRAAGMVLYYGSTRTSKCSSIYTGGRRVVIGCRTGCDPELLSQLSTIIKAGGLDAEVVNPKDFDSERWLKLAVNSAINPVTALSWDKNGVIARDLPAAQLAGDLARETGLVAEGLGIELAEDPVEATMRTARETAENCSSTVQDLAAGRDTELRYINLAVWEESLKAASRAVINLTVYRAVEVVSRWLRGRRSPCAR